MKSSRCDNFDEIQNLVDSFDFNADAAVQAANQAASSASSAAVSAQEAGTSASLASDYVVQTTANANSVNTTYLLNQALYEQFSSRFLGAFSTPPTLDNQNNPLIVGAMYFDLVANALRVWDGFSWVSYSFSESTPFVASGNTARSLVSRHADAINVRDFGAVGNGFVDDTAAIQAAISTGQKVFFSRGTYLISANLTTTAATSLEFRPGAVITSVDPRNIVMNNNAKIIAHDEQIFSGEASATNLQYSKPEWWGATNSTTVVCNTAFQKALDALRVSGHLELVRKFYSLDGTAPLQVAKGQQISGAGNGWYGTVIYITTAAKNAFNVSAESGFCLSGVRITGPATPAPTSGTIIAIENTGAGRFLIEKVSIIRCWNAMNFIGVSNENRLGNGIIRDTNIYAVYNRGLYYQWAANIMTNRVMMDSDPGPATEGCVVMRDLCQSVDFAFCNFSNSDGNGLSIDAAVNARKFNTRWCQFTSCLFDDANFGGVLNNCDDIRFVNCWFSSNGRTPKRTGGDGLWIKSGCRGIVLNGGVFANNGQRGIVIDAGAQNTLITNAQIAGNNMNVNEWWGIDIAANTTDFTISQCSIGNGFDWPGVQHGGILIRAGTSDRYQIVNNLFCLVPPRVTLDDNGTGTDKLIQGNFNRST